MQAGFSEIDITPPVGTRKIGWIKEIVSDQVIDPLYARVAVLDNGADRVAFIQLDTLSIRWTQVRDIRTRIEAAYGFPGGHIMVSATHNHAGPAVADSGRTSRDAVYIETLVTKCVQAFGQALAGLCEAEVGFRHVFETEVGFNRRVVMRNGLVKTQQSFPNDPDCLYIEGPMDPEVAVLALRRPGGALLGCLVNFACHPTHLGGGAELSGGFPALVCRNLKQHGCPVTLYLNGAGGNIMHMDFLNGRHVSMEEAGERLTADVCRALDGMTYAPEAALGVACTTLQLPYRQPTPEEVAGTIPGAQRFVDPELYDEGMAPLLERIRNRRTQPADVQVLFIGNVALAGIPAEYFVQHGLRIKTASHPAHALVVGQANGMIGYVPHREAFARGGYETTFCSGSRLAPEAGDLLADAAIALIQARRGMPQG
jgi:neutral ceramidase